MFSKEHYVIHILIDIFLISIFRYLARSTFAGQIVSILLCVQFEPSKRYSLPCVVWGKTNNSILKTALCITII